MEKVRLVFSKMDKDGSGKIDHQETLSFWKKNFGKLNTDALFQDVDINHDGEIEEGEWIVFWRRVKKMGNTEEEMLEELEAVEKGESWCHFAKHT